MNDTVASSPTSLNRGAPAPRSGGSFLSHPSFAAAFQQGLGVGIGILAGAMIWISAQPLPIVPPYVHDVYIVKPITTAPVQAKAVKSEPATVIAPPSAPIEVAKPVEAVPHPEPELVKPVPMPEAVKAVPVPDPSKPRTEPPPPPTGMVPAVDAKATASIPAASVRTKIKLPLDGLTENKPPYGPLPIIRAADKMRPFDAYRQPVDETQLNKPLLALAMMDYGLSATSSGSIIGVMPANISVIVSSAARDSQNWAQKAHDDGHEVWLQLSAEPDDYPASDPGEHALMTAASIEQNQDALSAQMGTFAGYTGLFATESSPYFTSGADADFVANAVFARGLGLILNAPAPDKALQSTAQKQHAPYYGASVIRIDNVSQAIEFMATAEHQATVRGYSVVLFAPNPAIRKAVLDWTARLEKSGFALAPLSVIAERGVDLMEHTKP